MPSLGHFADRPGFTRRHSKVSVAASIAPGRQNYAAMLLEELVRTSTEVAGTRSRLAKTAALAAVLANLARDEIPIAVAYLSGELPQGSIGIGWASLRELPAPASEPSLQILDIDAAATRIAGTTGPGSQAARRTEITVLFERATDIERDFLVRLLLGDLRQGALEGVMIEAVAKASGIAAAEVRRAVMLSGKLGGVAQAALTEGVSALAGYRLEVLRPIKPMLAQSADTIEDALARLGRAAVEWKLDGARVQVHRLGQEIRAFTRNLADVTDRLPEVEQALARIDAESIVLDGEAIALDAAARAHSFQTTMSRFGSKLEAKRVTDVPLSLFFFDCLHVDGVDLIDEPSSERADKLLAVCPPDLIAPRLVTADPVEAGAFLDDTLKRGHEGVVVKALDAPYEAGRRGAGWIKVKRALTLDLVVLAAEWGHGRRRGWLSNLHLGARDPNGGFVMLGKTFKGMTDEMLTWQTERLQQLEIGREGIVVHVRPELVVEVAFDGIQRSPRYPGGLALRFARIKGYRSDKTAAEADTIDTVRSIHAGANEG